MFALVILSCLQSITPIACTPLNYSTLVYSRGGLAADECNASSLFAALRSVRQSDEEHYLRGFCVSDALRIKLESERV